MGIETFFKKAAITDVDKVQTPGTTRTISVQGPQDVDLMPNTFYTSEASQFAYNNVVVIFDGAIHLKTDYIINVSTPTVLDAGFYSESDDIYTTNFKRVESVVIS